tara:strand:- start:208 stop:351 length:144 start_codon:yes stop_codon:yes gene_type:complete
VKCEKREALKRETLKLLYLCVSQRFANLPSAKPTVAVVVVVVVVVVV